MGRCGRRNETPKWAVRGRVTNRVFGPVDGPSPTLGHFPWHGHGALLILPAVAVAIEASLLFYLQQSS